MGTEDGNGVTTYRLGGPHAEGGRRTELRGGAVAFVSPRGLGDCQRFLVEALPKRAPGRVLTGMDPDAPPDPALGPVPAAWTRTYTADGGPPGRVFTTTHGASEDFLDEGFRRLLINASLWAAGLEDEITPDLEISFVGPYHPARFAFEGYRRGVRPADLAGWDTPIMDPEKPTDGR